MSPEARAHRLDYQKRWYRANKAAQLLRTNTWRAENRERVNELARKRRLGNPVYLAQRKVRRAARVTDAAYERLRRTAKAKRVPHASRVELNVLWDLHDGRCGLTGTPIPAGVKPHLDHKVPAAKGGAHTIDNLRWVHPMANRAKGEHTDEEFLAWWNARA